MFLHLPSDPPNRNPVTNLPPAVTLKDRFAPVLVKLLLLGKNQQDLVIYRCVKHQAKKM